MTVNFFGIPGRGQIGNLQTNQVGESQKSSKTSGKESTSFSSALEGATSVQASGKVEDTERAARVQELKALVANGQYEPDLNKVASSLLKFLVEA
jgi:negative regulator of flagellin synthesis FlgM